MRPFAHCKRRFDTRFDEFAEKPPKEARKRDSDAFFGSIQGTLKHLLLTDRIGPGGFYSAKHGSRSLEGAALLHSPEALKTELFADFSMLTARAQIDHQRF